ncbi:MAG: c-type cytochrome, partial [Blastocatellia bacterium]
MRIPDSRRLLTFPLLTLLPGLVFQALCFPRIGSANLSVQSPPDRAQTLSPEGARLYKERCAVCHDNPEGRVPPLFLLRRRQPDEVVHILTSGAMKQQATGLSPDQIQALAVFVTGKPIGTGGSVGSLPPATMCKATA